MILETIQISQNATLTAILHGPSEEMQSDSALCKIAVSVAFWEIWMVSRIMAVVPF